MSLATMVAENRGAVPGYSALLARTHIRNAWTDIRNMRGWSFQLFNLGFGTPGLVNAGTVTVTWGSDQVVGDATAATAFASASTAISFITQRQFRVGASTIYNIIAYDGANTLTLDRPWSDVSQGPSLGYVIYQCYYPVPFDDFQAWESILDVVNVIWLNTNPTRGGREWADQWDPQRQIFENPQAVLPYGTDQRGAGTPNASSTLGRMMYELYPQPQAQYSYQTWGSRLGADLVNPQDTPPFPITEHLLKTLGRVKAYEWLIAKLTVENPNANVSGLQFTLQLAAKEAAAQVADLRSMDRDRVDIWKSTMSRIAGLGPVATFNPANGTVMSRNM